MYNNDSLNYGSRRRRIPRIGLILYVCWVIIVGGFLWLGIYDHKQEIYELAAVEARANFNKDLVYRRWSAGHGGTYVPITNETPANPFLSHIDERDISTPSGKALTLVNPAYMTRQVHELGKRQYGARGHITSLKPLRPENRPDKWETEALKAFEMGEDEIQSTGFIDQVEYLRLMRPMVTEKSCLKCHEVQGYKEGDLRGGISISVPLEPYQLIAYENIKKLTIRCLIILAVGLVGLGFGGLLLHKKDTDRLTVLAVLRESEEKYRSMMDAMKDPVYICSSDYRVEYMNPAMIKRTGRDDTEEFCFKAIHDLEAKCPWCLHPEIQTGQHLTADIVSPKDNRSYHVSHSPIVHEDGSISKMTVYRDTTELKSAEKSIRQSEKRFRNLFESISDLIYTQDLDGRFISVNPAMHRLFGYDMDEFIGYRGSDFMKPELRSDFDNKYLEGLKSQGYHEDISNYFKKDGSKIYIEYKSTLVRPSDGDPFISGMGRDVTDKVLSERKVKNLEAQVAQSQKMESIGTLAGGIAHDFNNILSPIVGYTEMLLEDIPADSPLRNDLDQILTGSLRARELVKRILTFSRQAEHEMKPVRVQLVIKEILKLLSSSLPATINIRQDISNECRRVMADPTQIHQIAMNLSTNAFHAMEETGGQLTISLKEIELMIEDLKDPDMIPGPHVCLTVADTGTGIEQSVMDRIFDPYFTTKKEGKGTGLGLAVIHGIIKSHGGHISVYSEPGKGAEFKVYLPVIKTQKRAQQVETALPIQKGTERILLVDDQDMIVQMIRQMLERLGYHVTDRLSSTDALEVFRAQPDKFDIVITDMTMPNMTGDKLAVELIKIRPDIPIILCTGFSERMPAEKATSLGIKSFLMKPVVMKDLANKIREVLDNNKS